MNFFYDKILSGKTCKKTSFIKNIIEGNLFETIPNENIYYSLLIFILKKDQKNINLFVEANKIEIDLILYLIKRNLCLEFIIKYLNNIKIRDYLYFLCIKELLIKNIIEIDINIILEVLDDFDLYKYCIKNNIKPFYRDTLNYQYYKIHNKELDSINLLLKKVKAYKDIEYIINLTGIAYHSDYEIDCILKFIKNGFDKNFCQKNIKKNDCDIVKNDFDIVNNNFNIVNNNFNIIKNDFNIVKKNFNIVKNDCDIVKNDCDILKNDCDIIKLLLGHLISTKNINYLVLALFISKKYAFTFENNYDIDLIYLFLLKYFLFYDELLIIFKKLDIKNNQLLNMSYIWSDVYIILLKNNKLISDNMKTEYLKYIEDLKQTLIITIPVFIESNKISHALDMIELYKDIENNIILLELQKLEFLQINKSWQFSDLLGTKCRYLFEKCKVLYSHSWNDNLFSNDILLIDDIEFKTWFKSLFNKYN